MNNPTEPATPRQLFALFCATGLNTKEVAITKADAAALITRSKAGDTEGVVSALQALGATGTPKVRQDYAALYAKAHEAGQAAASARIPVPMIVQQHANPLDDNSPVIHEYAPVMGGACGFAWVTIRPGTNGMAKWLKEHRGARKGYYGGMELWVSAYGQSMERKEAYAGAFAKVLRDAGIDASMSSRMD